MDLLEPAQAADPVAAYHDDPRPAPAVRPWVMVNMIASIDGATAIDGVSGGLGSDADKRVFRTLRSIADVILVGAGTVRAERYRAPLEPAGPDAAWRRNRKQAPRPRLAIVSRSLDFDLDSAIFADDPRPYVITTTDASSDKVRSVGERADVLTAGAGSVDLAAALGQLRGLGARVVLSEGGPTLNGQLAAGDLIDEMCLTMSPVLTCGSSSRIVVGDPVETRMDFVLDRVLHDSDVLLLRYHRDR